jgi:Phage tail tube protein
MAQQTGRVTIKLDNETLRSKGGASLQIGGIRRAFDATDQMESYYRESVIPAQIKCTMPHMSDTDLIRLRDWKNGTAHFTTDSGHTYTVANAAVAEIGDLANGDVDVTIGGDPAER